MDRGLLPILLALIVGSGCTQQQTTTVDVTPSQAAIDEQLRQHMHLGDQYRQSGLYTKAIEEYEQALNIDPENPEIYSRLGYALLETKDFAKAIQTYKRYVQLRPKDCNSHSSLAFAYMRQGLTDQAIRSYEDALRFCQDDANAFVQLGKAYQSGDYAIEAIECFRRAIEINPDDIQAYELLAKLCNDRKLYPEAIAAYKAIIEHPNHGKAPEWISWANGRVASLLRWAGAYAEAIPYYRAVLDAEPENGTAMRGIAACYENTGQTQLAVRFYEQLIADAPEKALYYYRLGELLNDMGDYAQAIERVRAGLKVDMGCSAQAYCVLGKAYEKLENYNRARQEFRNALDCNDARYNDYALKQIDRQDQLEKIKELKEQKEKYGY